MLLFKLFKDIYFYYFNCRNTKFIYSFFVKLYICVYLLFLYIYSKIYFKSNENLTYLYIFCIENLYYFIDFNMNLIKKDFFKLKFLLNLYFSLFYFLHKYINKVFFNFYDVTIQIQNKNYLVNFLIFLKNDYLMHFEIFNDLLAIDTLKVQKRFLLLYNFLSIKNCSRLNLFVYLKDFEKIYSISFLYSSGFWLEREVWDLSGIYFLNHNDLRRILTDYGFQGHPLRRDFPLTGFFELYYNYSFKKIVYEPVSLAQKYRNFYFENKWLYNKI